jgi:hypothetical protein
VIALVLCFCLSFFIRWSFSGQYPALPPTRANLIARCAHHARREHVS